MSIFTADSPEDPNTLSGRRMQNNGINLFRRYPHGASCPMLLEVALILKPEVNIVSKRQTPQFF